MTNTTPTDLQARMAALIENLAARDCAAFEISDLIYEARDLRQYFPKPIDPDVLAVREILAAWDIDFISSLLAERSDEDDAFQRALAAYKRIKADHA